MRSRALSLQVFSPLSVRTETITRWFNYGASVRMSRCLFHTRLTFPGLSVFFLLSSHGACTGSCGILGDKYGNMRGHEVEKFVL